MLISDFTKRQQQILRELDVGQYAGQTLIAHGLTKKTCHHYYVMHINLKTDNWSYQPDEPITPNEVAALLRLGGIKPTSVRSQYVLNNAIFKSRITRVVKRWIGRESKETPS